MIDVADFGLRPAQPTNWKVGDTAGRWTLLGFGKREGGPHFHAVAQCSCGSPPKVVQVPNITNGLSTNCGCVRREKMTKHGASKRLGGDKRDPLYRVWYEMVARCTDTKHDAFPRYGGRGITVCERWRDVRLFIQDMSPTYQPGLTIERRENSEGYSPDNCAWGTRTEQTRNRRSTLLLTHEGVTKPLIEWADEAGLSYLALWTRIRAGWPVQEALSMPKRRGKTWRSRTRHVPS